MGTKGQKPFGFELTIDPKEKLSLQPLMFAFAAFAATFPLYSPNMGIFNGFIQGEAVMGYFVFPMVISGLVSAFATVLYAVKHRDWQCFGLMLLGGGTLLYFGGAFCFFVIIQAPLPLPPVAVIAGTCVGCGLVPLCVAWGTHFAMPLKNALLWGAIVCVIASLLSWCLSIIPRYALWFIYPTLVLLGSLMPFAKMKKGTLSYPQPDKAHIDKSEFQEEGGREGLLSSLKRLLSIIWLPFSGLMLYAFLTSVHKLYVFELLDSEFLGGAVAALCILPLCFIKTNKPLLPFVYKVIIPIFAAILIVLGSFPVDSLPQFIGAVGIYVFCVFLALLAMALFVGVSYAGEFSPAFIYGFALFCGTAVTLFGLIQSHIVAITDNFGPVMWIITCVYFAVLIVHLGISSWNTFTQPENATKSQAPSKNQAASLQENLQIRCTALSKQYRLSERETEILEYIGRGYSPAYIAKTLVISVSTARSHVRNIYRKIGVGSREELLQLIDEED